MVCRWAAWKSAPALIPHSEPEDPQLPKLSLVGATLPALLPFPEKASVLFKAVERGRDVGIQALEALLLRAWTCLPPGKVRCTIIDPVGRGENFAAFMHLADQDESLITSRIWTETSHIDQRLTDMTTHMETVLQKYLRNRYETLAEYNAQAGEVAEPFRLLVVAHFPVNFSTDAARRLISLASAGARCGIYTLVMVDAKQPMPHGVELADLEAACINLVWREGRISAGAIRDFGDFPLTLATPPGPGSLHEHPGRGGRQGQAGQPRRGAVRVDRSAREEMWTTDSRARHRRAAGPGRGDRVTVAHARQGHVAARPHRRQDRLGQIDAAARPHHATGPALQSRRSRAVSHRLQEGRRVQDLCQPSTCPMPASWPWKANASSA